MKPGSISAGHPVDVGSGNMYNTYRDVRIPGRFALDWERRYNTGLLDHSIQDFTWPLGAGWFCPYFAALSRIGKDYHFRTPDGSVEVFRDPDDSVDYGKTLRNPGSFLEIAKAGFDLKVTSWNVETGEIRIYVFRPGRNGRFWPLRSLEDDAGQGLDLAWDENGLLKGVRQRVEKRTLVVGYTAAGKIASVSFLLPDNSKKTMARYEYDAQGRMISASDALGNADRFEYDADGRFTREINKDGGVFCFRYDDKGRCIRTWGQDNYDLKILRYLDHVSMTEVVNSYGHVTRYRRLATGQIDLEIDANGFQKETRYDELGRITQQIDPMGAKKEYKYDDLGNRSEVVRADGKATKYAFNARHQLVRLEDPSGSVWERKYDEFNRLVELSNPLGETWQKKYDRRGMIMESRDPEGRAKVYTYTENGDLTGIRDREGNEYRFATDLWGRISKRLDPSGKSSGCEYDDLGRPVKLQYPGAREIRLTYGTTRKPLSIDYGKGRIYRFKYGPCGRILEETDPMGKSLVYKWGTEPGHMLAIRNPNGEIHEFEYDPSGRLIGEKDFSGRRLEYRYDGSGNCIGKTNGAAQRVDIKRDVLGRITEQSSVDGKISEFEYDGLGYLIRASNQDSDIRFVRDPLGRIIREIQDGTILESSYDKNGNRSGFSASFGLSVAREFDGNGCQTAMTVDNHAHFRHGRNSVGQETLRKLPGDIELRQDYDPLGNLAAQALVAISAPLWKKKFTYTGNLLDSIEDSQTGNSSYTYDAAERLVGEKQPNIPVRTYHYDANSNISSTKTGGEEIKADYSPGNVLKSRGGWDFQYDANGRMIRKSRNSGKADVEQWSFEWDALDRLKKSSGPDGKIWEYKYDAFGRRLAKCSGESKTSYVWDRNSLIFESDGEEKSVWIYNAGGFSPLATIQNGRTYSVICDHIGTPKSLVDDEGRVEWTSTLDAWGAVVEEGQGSGKCPIRFPGQWHDRETGLTYNRFRYYQPETGRYLSPDPLGISAGPNSYNYTRNPVNLIDPLGLCPTEEHPEREPYVMGPHDEDWRGTGQGHREAIDEAFARTGQPREEFEITRWGRDEHGKSFPAEWRHPSGAEVNIDAAHLRNGPDVPHVGWQTGGKRNSGGGARGHILLDDVPYNR